MTKPLSPRQRMQMSDAATQQELFPGLVSCRPYHEPRREMPGEIETWPAGMKARPQWMGWRWETDHGQEGQWACDVRTLQSACVDNSAAWASFAQAWDAFERGRVDGVLYCPRDAEDGVNDPWPDLPAEFIARRRWVDVNRWERSDDGTWRPHHVAEVAE